MKVPQYDRDSFRSYLVRMLSMSENNICLNNGLQKLHIHPSRTVHFIYERQANIVCLFPKMIVLMIISISCSFDIRLKDILRTQ